MALALILALEPTAAGVMVRYDIGKNRYVRWQVGESVESTGSGLPRLSRVGRRSELIGPLDAAACGRGQMLIPADAINRDWRKLQLLSYRDADGTGPAVSAIGNIPLPGTFPASTDSPPPPAGLAVAKTSGLFNPTQHTRGRAMTGYSESYAQAVDNVPFTLSERKFSQPLFLEAIVGALPSLLPMLAPAIGSFVAGVAPSVGQVAGNLLRRLAPGGGDAGQQTAVAQIGNLADQAIRALGPSAQQVLTAENMREIMRLIQAGQAAAAAPSPVTPSQAQALAHYSQAQVAPALLAALPALMPLLQQVLSPQTVQSIIDAPQRMTGQVIDGIKDFARLGLEADQQLQQHLERLNPGVDDPALHQLLAGLSLELSSSRTRNYKRVASVQLTLDEVQTQMLFGREQSLYHHRSALQFPLSVSTPQTIRDAEVMLQIKQAGDLRVVYEISEPVGEVGNGPLQLIPRVEANVTQSLDPRKDHIVVLTLLWQNGRGHWRGTSVQHSIALMGEYRFDRVEESGDLIPLNDREAYRDYWHQIWESDFDSDTRRADIHSRYYLTLDPERNRNARVDSQVRSEREGARVTVHLRSGYEFSLFALNHLLGRLAPDQPVLSEAILQALANGDFIERFNQAAQHQGRIRGRPGDRAALWVYPVFKLQNLVLVKASEINEHGNVLRLGEERVTFPLPAMLHFVGAVSA